VIVFTVLENLLVNETNRTIDQGDTEPEQETFLGRGWDSLDLFLRNRHPKLRAKNEDFR
jgi:hypothetical protein